MTGDDIGERVKKHFAAFDRAKFAEWLEKGLTCTYLPSHDSENSHPFAPVYPRIIYHDADKGYENVVDFLGRVYDKFFSNFGKQMFREAISDVLRKQISQMVLSAEACKDLIYLISEVNAEESLESLISFVDKPKLGEKGEELYVAIDVLKSFKPSMKVYEAVERLADSPNFDEGYLFEVIEILVENQPSNTRNILKKFESRINALYSSLPKDIKEREAFLECKDKCLDFVSRKADPAQYRDTWLTKDYRSLDKGK